MNTGAASARICWASGLKSPQNTQKQAFTALLMSALPAYFNQPRFLKYHIGTRALATISATV